MGINNAELWCNIGLCCFYSAQYDMTLSCFERALNLASDDNMADVWYNIGHVAIGIGDVGLAYQAFKIAVSVDPNHAESYNNLGVLEMRKSNASQAQSNFQTAESLADYLFEPTFNLALSAFKRGAYEMSFRRVQKAMELYPDHSDSKALERRLRAFFTHL